MVMIPIFEDFRSDWVPILFLIMIRSTFFFCIQNCFVSITFSSRDTYLNLKLGLIFHQNVFKSFSAFCINFLLDF